MNLNESDQLAKDHRISLEIAERYASLKDWNLILNIVFTSVLGSVLLLWIPVLVYGVGDSKGIKIFVVFHLVAALLYFLRKSASRQLRQVKQQIERTEQQG